MATIAFRLFIAEWGAIGVIFGQSNIWFSVVPSINLTQHQFLIIQRWCIRIGFWIVWPFITARYRIVSTNIFVFSLCWNAHISFFSLPLLLFIESNAAGNVFAVVHVCGIFFIIHKIYVSYTHLLTNCLSYQLHSWPLKPSIIECRVRQSFIYTSNVCI